ncbi:MAG: NADAR family protein [Pseudomonadales bacterium]
MALFPDYENALRVSMLDAADPLASYSKHGFELDGQHWLSAEHYVQGMQFEDTALQAKVAAAEHPDLARRVARKHRRATRQDWNKLQVVYMTRAVYIKARTHSEVAQALLQTGQRPIVETSQYDYFWGCGRDTRGANHYGRVLMDVRGKLRDELSDKT